MASKLPKPMGIKPQTKVVKHLGTISENVRDQKIRAHEAPPSTSRFISFVPNSRLVRRSKSCTDVSSIGFQTESKQSTQNKVLNIRKPVKAVSIKSEVKPNRVMGTKRPLADKNDDGVPKLKVSKKVPDWDYKTRFNLLNEKYQHAQELIKDMRNKVTRKYKK